MTQNQVINKLALELAFQTGRMEDMKLYKQYLRMALVVGIDHFTVDMEEVIAMDSEGHEVGRYKSVTDAAKKLGVDRSDIVAVLNSRKQMAGGYLFVKVTDKKLIKNPVKPFAELIPANGREYSGWREHQL